MANYTPPSQEQTVVMATNQRTCLFLFSVASLFVSCGDPNSTPGDKRVEFVPGRYRAEIIEIESDCEPPLEDIIAASNQPRAGIVELLWRGFEEPPVPTAEFALANPRLERNISLFTTTRCEEPSCSFLPGEKINDQSGVRFFLECNQPTHSLIPGPEIEIFQGSSRGVFLAETIHPWTEPLVSEPNCLPMETFPRKACTERFVTRYTLVRECPLNCTASGSGYGETTIDIFPELEGNYRDVTRPEELYECVPFETRDPLFGGECPEEFIVP